MDLKEGCAAMMAMLADEDLERMADYVRRGRPMSAVDTEELKASWVEHFHLHIAEAVENDTTTPMDDAECELKLRKVELPREEIKDAVLAYAEQVMMRTFSYSVAERKLINDRLAQDLARAHAKHGSKH